MHEYTTYIFEKSKKKYWKRLAYNFVIVLFICAIVYLTIVGIVGIGFSFVGTAVLIITLVRMKNNDDKAMGITAYGTRGSKFTITETGFKLGESFLPFSELEDLIIYVDEYAGMPRDLMGVRHGGNNEIRFRHKGQSFSIHYIIKNRADFRYVEQLVAKIEDKY